MGFTSIIMSLSPIVWAFPPFRQYKGKFFNYFFIITIGDPAVAILINLGYRNSYSLYAVMAAALLLSVIALNKNISRIPALSFVLFSLSAGIFMPLAELKLMTAAIFIILIYNFIRYMIVVAGKYGRVSLFHILFLIYNLSIVFKLVNVALELQKGHLYFLFTTVFDILLGVLFCIFREDDERFAWKLSKSFS